MEKENFNEYSKIDELDLTETVIDDEESTRHRCDASATGVTSNLVTVLTALDEPFVDQLLPIS